MQLSCDVVVTGLGVVTPIGIGSESFWESIINLRSGVRLLDPPGYLPEFDLGAAASTSRDGNVADAAAPYSPYSGMRAWLAAPILDFDAKEFVTPRKALKLMSREHQYAFAASKMACDCAGIAPGAIDPDRIGTVFGSEMIFSEIADIEQVVRHCENDGEMVNDAWGPNAPQHMNPLWMLKSLPNMPACHVGIALDARGPNNTILSEETSALVALLEAAMIIDRGLADVMIVGVAGSRINPTRMLQRHESDYSHRYDNPAGACRPFAADRDGTVLAEGAASVVLERREHADRRNAKPIARLLSWCNTFSKSILPWSGSIEAVSRSLSRAIGNSGYHADDIDHVNANAKGTRVTDAHEAQGIAALGQRFPVTAIKGYIGESAGTAGMIELCASLLGSTKGLVPPTVNCDRVGDDCPIDVIRSVPKPWQRPLFAKLCTTPHGHAITAIFERLS